MMLVNNKFWEMTRLHEQPSASMRKLRQKMSILVRQNEPAIEPPNERKTEKET